MWKAILISAAMVAPAFADPVEGMAVADDVGQQLGRVVAVERDAEGRILAASFEGLEAPADAPEGLEAQEEERPFVVPPSRRLVADAGAQNAPSGGRRASR